MKILDSVKALYRDKKKRPWLIAGGAATAAAGILTMRRPTDPQERNAEAIAADQASPVVVDEGISSAGAGTSYLPPVIYGGGGGESFYDPAFAEMDFSPVYDAIAVQGEEQTVAIESAVSAANERARARTRAIKKQVKRVGAKVERAEAVNQRQKRKIAQLQKRVKAGPKSKPRGRR